jgi:hypothetical protein
MDMTPPRHDWSRFMQVSTRLSILAVLAAALLAVAACAPAYHLTVEPAGAALTGPQAQALAAAADVSALASVSTTDAPAMRTTVLTQLRAQGAFGSRAADLLTIGFPAVTASVPVLVRGCKVDGVDAVLVVEAWGSSGGRLVHRRLWVFDRATGTVIRASSFR